MPEKQTFLDTPLTGRDYRILLVDLLHEHQEAIVSRWKHLTEQQKGFSFRNSGEEQLILVYQAALNTVRKSLRGNEKSIDLFLSDPVFLRFRQARDPLIIIQSMRLSKQALRPVIIEYSQTNTVLGLELAALFDDQIEAIIEAYRIRRIYPWGADEALSTFQSLMDTLPKLFSTKSLTFDADTLLKFFANELMEAIFSIDCLVYRMDPRQQKLVLKTEGIQFSTLSEEMQKALKQSLDPQTDLFIREILEKKTIILSTDVKNDPRANREIARVTHMESFMGIPFIVRGSVEAIMTVCTYEGDLPFSREQITLMENLSKTVSVMLENIILQEESRQQVAENQGIERITSALMQELDSQQVMKLVCSEAQRLTRARGSAVCFFPEGGDDLALEYYSGRLPSPAEVSRYASIGSDAIRENRVILQNAGFAASSPLDENAVTPNLMVAPLITSGIPIGGLILTDKPEDFTDHEARVIRIFSDQAAVAIQNARLRERVRRMAVLEERERLAREIHDNVAQVLSALKLQASFARELLQQGQEETALQSLIELNRTATEANSEIRDAIFSLRTNASSDQELLPALRAYLERFQKLYHLDVELIASESEILPLHANAVVHIPRIIQEALTNIRKHAQATRVVVQFSRVGDNLQISITDNGVGFETGQSDQARMDGVGIQMMKERAAEIGGQLEIYSSPQNGCQVTISLPDDRKG